MVVDERGEARGGASMVDGGLLVDFGRGRHGRARGGMEELRGEVAQLGGQRIEVGRRGLTGATSGGGFTRFCSLELGSSCTEEEKEDWDGTRSFEVVREVKSGARTRWPTRGSSPPATVAGMASGRHSEVTVSSIK